jgi:hypothetical protein
VNDWWRLEVVSQSLSQLSLLSRFLISVVHKKRINFQLSGICASVVVCVELISGDLEIFIFIGNREKTGCWDA